MSEEQSGTDFWYAVNNTEILTLPSRRLETFGATMLNYYVISELMDSVNQVRVREGRIEAFRPQIITPASYEQSVLEGFAAEEAGKYLDWIREHEKDLRILQYGFKIRKQEFSEQVLLDNVTAVTERVRDSVKQKHDPFSAIIRGVDKPWEVSLIKLIHEVIRRSMPFNVRELEKRNLFGETDGVPNTIREEIEAGFLVAQRDPTQRNALAAKLEKLGIFDKYQDRFFALVRSKK